MTGPSLPAYATNVYVPDGSIVYSLPRTLCPTQVASCAANRGHKSPYATEAVPSASSGAAAHAGSQANQYKPHGTRIVWPATAAGYHAALPTYQLCWVHTSSATGGPAAERNAPCANAACFTSSAWQLPGTASLKRPASAASLLALSLDSVL